MATDRLSTVFASGGVIGFLRRLAERSA